MASSPIRRPTADTPAHRSKSLLPERPRHYSIQSSPGPSTRGISFFGGRATSLVSPYGSSPLRNLGYWSSGRESIVDADELAAARKKQKWVLDGWSEKWRDADSDGEEVDLSTMTVHRSDGTVAKYDPPDPDLSDEDDAEADDDVSISGSGSDDSSDDVLGDWTEREAASALEEQARMYAKAALRRSRDPFFSSDAGDEDEMLRSFMQEEERRKARSRERSISALAVSESGRRSEAEDADVDVDINWRNGRRAIPSTHDRSPMPEEEVEAVIARAKDLRQPYSSFLASAFAVSPSPEPHSPPPMPASSSATHIAPPYSTSEKPRRAFWQHRLPTPAQQSIATKKKDKGKQRMAGERASDPTSAASPTVRTDLVLGKVPQTGAASPSLLTPKTTTREVEQLDPYYYRTSTYKNGAHSNVRTCRLCRAAGGARARLAAHCRGCVSFKDCRFSNNATDPAQDTAADSAIDADLDETPTTRPRIKLRTKRRSKLQPLAPAVGPNLGSTPVAKRPKPRRDGAKQPDPTVDVGALDKKLYYHSLLTHTYIDEYRRCAICARLDGEARRLSFWCRGRISFRDCVNFDGDEKAYLAQVRRRQHKRSTQNTRAPPPPAAMMEHQPSTMRAAEKSPKTFIGDTAKEEENMTDTATKKRGRPRSIIRQTPSPYHPKLHQLHHGGYLHCRLCRDAGAERAQKSGYCKGRMGMRLCHFNQDQTPDAARTFDRTIDSADAAPSAAAKQYAVSADRDRRSTAKVSQPKSSVRLVYRQQTYVAAPVEGVSHPPTDRGPIDRAADILVAASPPREAGREDVQSFASVPRKIARPRPKTPLASSTGAWRPVSAPPNRAPSLASGSSFRAKAKPPAFDIIIPTKPRASKTPEVRPRPIERVLDTPVSPVIQPKHLDFGRPSSAANTQVEGNYTPPMSSPLPPSSPPSEPSARPIRPLPASARPTPPNSTRDRSTVTPLGRDVNAWRQPIKSSLRLSSEVSDAPRSAKRARFSMPLSPTSDRGQGQASFRILQPRSESPSEKEESVEPPSEDLESSDDDGFLLVPPSAKRKSPSARSSSQANAAAAQWTSSPFTKPIRPEWTPNSNRLPPTMVAKYASAFEDRSLDSPHSAPKRSLMLPPPVPSRLNGSQYGKIPRSEPRPTGYKVDRPNEGGVSTAVRPRSKSLALHKGEKRPVSMLSGSRMVTVGTNAF